MSSQPSGSEPRGLRVMAALSPPRPFRRLASRGPFFRGFPVWWTIQFAVYLGRCLTLQDSVSCTEKGLNTSADAARHSVLLILYRPVAWPISIRVDANTTLWRTWYGLLIGSFFRLYHMLSSGTNVLWVAAGFIRRTRPIQSFTVAERYKWWTSWKRSSCSSASTLGTRCSSTARNTASPIWTGIRVSIFLMTAFDALFGNTRGLIGSPTSPQLSRERIHNYFTRLAKNNDIICLQEILGKHEFPQAIQVLAPQFRLCGTFIPKNFERRRIGHLHSQESLIWRSNHKACGYLPRPWSHCEHTVWCPQPGCRQRPFLARSDPEEPTWKTAAYHSTLATIPWRSWSAYGGFQYLRAWGRKVQCLELDLHWWLRWKLLSSCSFSSHVLEIAQPHFTRRDSTADGTISHVVQDRQGTHQSRYGWGTRCSLLFSCVWDGKRCIPSDHAAVRVVIQKPTNSVWPGQAHSELDVQTSRSLLNLEADQRRPPMPWRPIRRSCRFQNHFMNVRHRTAQEPSSWLLLTAWRAYGNSTWVRWCTAAKRKWEPVGKCFDQCSFEYIDFHGFNQIITILIRERIADREAEIRNISAGQETKGCHSLAPRRITKAGLCQTSVFTCFQNSWASQSLSHCTDSAQMKLAPRASRPGLTVRSLRILCKGLCRRFHAEGQEQMCKVECPDDKRMSSVIQLLCLCNGDELSW